MAEESVSFKLRDKVTEVSLLNGKVAKPGDTVKTSDDNEIAVYRATSGLEEVKKGGKD